MLTPRRRHLISALATTALLATVPLAATAGSGAHAVPTADAAAGARALVAQPPAGTGWIEGWAVDRAAVSQLDVLVEAFRPADLRTPVASALSYAGPNVRGDEVDGYFRLQVPEGRYVLRLTSMPGASDPFRTSWFGRGAPVRVVGGTAEVGDMVLTRVRKVDARTVVRLERARVKKGRQGVVDVTVSDPEVLPVTGKVRVSVNGRRLADLPLRRGAASAVLPRLGLGTHRVSAQFLGNDAVRAGRAVSTVLSVVRR